jgi:hypothetical protein
VIFKINLCDLIFSLKIIHPRALITGHFEYKWHRMQNMTPHARTMDERFVRPGSLERKYLSKTLCTVLYVNCPTPPKLYKFNPPLAEEFFSNFFVKIGYVTHI